MYIYIYEYTKLQESILCFFIGSWEESCRKHFLPLFQFFF